MRSRFIPFNRPCFQGKELEYVEKAVANGHISGDGSFTKKCNSFFEQEIGVPKALLATSCTHALALAALLLGIKPIDGYSSLLRSESCKRPAATG